LEAQGERLLHELLSKEKSLVGKVEEARAKAMAAVELAQEESTKILAAARVKADDLAKQEAEAGRQEAEAARESVVSAAKSAAAALTAQARANRDGAVTLVMEKVLP